MPKKQDKAVHYFSEKSFGMNGVRENRLKKLYFTASEITRKLFSLSKTHLLATFKAKKTEPQFCIKITVRLWRTGWDSNPRAGITDKLISSQPRYDHFDTRPYIF